ncbi:discoidin domain-containing protein, partial [Rhizobium etli]|uniref:discoidin domain-containing protein n=1 Tax=Rhizobium etli TaxID=29449 RepID=UPI00030617ED
MQLLRECVVTASSGCHRYPYWNEQFLFDGREDTGWCTPSRSQPTTEFLEIDLGKETVLQQLRILSRKINADAGFPGKIVASAWKDGTWAEFWEQQEIVNTPDAWHTWDIGSTKTSKVRLEFSEVGRRPEGKYFLQFMELELLSPADEEIANV